MRLLISGKEFQLIERVPVNRGVLPKSRETDGLSLSRQLPLVCFTGTLSLIMSELNICLSKTTDAN